MAVNQTECYRVVTIGYLKSFIDSNVQDSSNGSVILINRTDDTYCPTYGELTGGTIIQTWSQGSTPNGDRDGITVNPSAILGGTYTANQCVDQRDLVLVYTRFKSFTVSSESGDISQCGGSKTVSYSHNYTRYTKSMDDSCAVTTTGIDVADTENNEVSWNPGSYGTISYPTYSIGRQPENRVADRRCTTVTGSVTFRGAGHSDTTTICQSALGGGYNNYEGRHYTGVSAYATTSTSFGCAGGSFGINSTGYFYDRYEWMDDCGTVYHSSPYNDVVGSEGAGGNSGSFGALDCCNGTQSNSTYLSVSYYGYSDGVTFSQYCEDCSSQCVPPTPPHAPDKYRGTDNGSDFIDGVWYTHPANIGWKGESGDMSDTICVPSLYYRGLVGGDSGSTKIQIVNGSHTSPSTAIQINSWLYAYWDSSAGYGYGSIAFVANRNNTDSVRRVTFILSTDYSGNIPVGPRAGLPAATEWQYEVKQAPYNHYWYSSDDHSYTTQPVECCTGPCPGTTTTSGCWAVEDCDCSVPDTGVCNSMIVYIKYDTDITCDSSGHHVVNFRIANYNSNCGSMYMQLDATDSVRTQVNNFYIDHNGSYAITFPTKFQGSQVRLLFAWVVNPGEWSQIEEAAIPNC